MSVQKSRYSAAEAIANVPEGATILVGAFGVLQGWPHELLFALRDQGVKDLTLICNSPGFGPLSPQILSENGQIKKLIASFGGYSYRTTTLSEQIGRGEVEFEMVPQGTLVERIRAGGAGIPAFFTPTGVGTVVAEGKEKRVFNGREYLLETALRADFALIRAYKADIAGNLVYRRTARNFNPPFATAADVTLAEVDEIVGSDQLDPEAIATPGIFVQRLVQREELLERETVFELMRTRQKRKSGRKCSRDGKWRNPRTHGPTGCAPFRVRTIREPWHWYANFGVGLHSCRCDAARRERSSGVRSIGSFCVEKIKEIWISTTPVLSL